VHPGWSRPATRCAQAEAEEGYADGPTLQCFLPYVTVRSRVPMRHSWKSGEDGPARSWPAARRDGSSP